MVPRKEIYLELLEIPYDGLDRSIDLRVSRLRRKLGDDPNTPNGLSRSAASAICWQSNAHGWQSKLNVTTIPSLLSWCHRHSVCCLVDSGIRIPSRVWKTISP
ncbi:MAG: hypothetical protein R3C56_06325 [Pirellulaceae bacterium]